MHAQTSATMCAHRRLALLLSRAPPPPPRNLPGQTMMPTVASASSSSNDSIESQRLSSSEKVFCGDAVCDADCDEAMTARKSAQRGRASE